MEALTLEGEQQRVTLQKFVAEHEASERYLREELEEHVRKTLCPDYNRNFCVIFVTLCELGTYCQL